MLTDDSFRKQVGLPKHKVLPIKLPQAKKSKIQHGLTASARTGLSPAALSDLSSVLGSPGLSQTASRRIKMDTMIDKLDQPEQSQSTMEMIMLMDERQSSRDLQYRRERDQARLEADAKREEARLEERRYQEEREDRMARRDQQNQQMMLLFMAKMFGNKDSQEHQ